MHNGRFSATKNALMSKFLKSASCKNRFLQKSFLWELIKLKVVKQKYGGKSFFFVERTPKPNQRDAQAQAPTQAHAQPEAEEQTQPPQQSQRQTRSQKSTQASSSTQTEQQTRTQAEKEPQQKKKKRGRPLKNATQNDENQQNLLPA